MHPEPQTTYLHVELLHPPKNYRDKRVFDKVNLEIGEFAPVYSQLQVLEGGTGARLTGRVQETRYLCEFRQDRLLVSEENPRSGLGEFDQNLLKIVNISLKTLQVHFFIAQTSVVRCLLVPSNFTDARVFLAERVCSLKEDVSRLAKAGPIRIYGLRFGFLATPQRQLSHNVRVESLAEDPSKIWVENVGVFSSRPITPPHLSVISQNLAETSRFVEEDIFKFLAHFDLKKE
jgi:hypothetical protein